MLRAILAVTVFTLLMVVLLVMDAQKGQPRPTDVYQCGTTLKYCMPGRVPSQDCTFVGTMQLNVPREVCG